MMKVKVGQLKTHLSKYLRQVQETGESIEVCVREKPVAYLTPIEETPTHRSDLTPEVLEQLAQDGITIIPARVPKGDWVPTPGKARDGKTIDNSVVAMRQEKDW